MKESDIFITGKKFHSWENFKKIFQKSIDLQLFINWHKVRTLSEAGLTIAL